MKKKPELDDVEVMFDPTPLTKDEEKLISEFIRKGKTKKRSYATYCFELNLDNEIAVLGVKTQAYLYLS